MAVSARRCHFSLTSFSVSLLCNLVLSAFSLPKQILMFHTSQKVSWFFDPEWFFFFKSHHKLSWRLSYVTLLGPPALSCFRHLSWDSRILPATAAVKTCFTCKTIKTADPPLELLDPFIFCSFKHWHSNTVVASVVQTTFSLIFLRPYLLQKIQLGFKIIFSKTVEECPEVLGCWIVSESSVKDFRRSLCSVKRC